MYSYRSTAIRVLRLRVKDKHAAWLCGLAREVNTVFNYCNELSVKVFERERRFLSGFDFWPFLKGVTRGDCSLNLPIQAVQEIAEEYARRRRQHQKIRLAWRKSGGARRSLGWIPFKVRTIRYRGVEGDRSTSRDVGCRSGTAMVSVTSNCVRVISVKTAADAGI
jgi:putative transposase